MQESTQHSQSIIASSLAWIPFFISPFFWPNTPLDSNTVDVLFLATGLFAAAVHWTNEQSISNNLWPWLFLCLCLLPTAILLFADDIRSPWHAFRGLLYLTSSWLVFRMFDQGENDILGSRLFAIILTVASFFYIAYALLQAWDLRFLTGDRLFAVWSARTARYPGPLMQANWQGLFLSLVSVVLFFHGSAERPSRKWLFAAVVPIMGVLLTASRASLIILICGLIPFFLLNRNDRRFLIAAGSTILVAIILTITVNYVGILGAPDNDLNMLNRLSTGSFSDRLAVWAVAFEIIRNHLFFGIGWQNMPAFAYEASLSAAQSFPSLASALSVEMYRGHLWAHNTILQFTMAAGVMGFSAIMMLLYTILSRLLVLKHWRGLVENNSSSLGLLLASMIFFHGMISVSTMQPFFMILFAFLLAAGLSQRNEQAKQ